MTVLLVDDSPTVRAVLRAHLSSEADGFDVIEADNGARALSIARLMTPELVIADVNMPEMDGITFVRSLRADPKPSVSAIPVILLTGDLSESLRAEGLSAGANMFVHKPVQADELLAAVHRLLSAETK